MRKFITPIINLLLCSYLTLAYILSWVEFETWHDKTISLCIITVTTYIISIVLNKLSPCKIDIFGGFLDVLSGPLLIVGAFACIAFLEPWPLKLIGLFIYVVAMFCLPTFINIDEE
ncbi:hypothetical protein PYW49_16665 [Enterobacter sp. 170198]|uniref:Transporter n=1 Tax=Enterobacter chinensis TaxID=3030997 RepID=A0ABU5D5P3_9ENTR|nr:hypothetical protein [Enterobacter sp. 170198]MDY0419286.1 hypothetical protein [Enterobacter sp. 170198]